ncbi:hypothetical protein [Puniceibacterium sediminis]|uniref:Uncharacterized protein n=1 Tax=Puniceibacterium sediminis TaxID=1608407 RepID=A0A238UXZ7_9RHOB|nr:hypothetical protein [Puniceibacterium sediminis]SNR26916.1 hypothetical protein SAMN06265370_101306 [Puniceibacterium sediminis]
MAERHRSKDGKSETAEVLGQSPEDASKGPAQQGRSGGELQRKVGTRDEGKRYDETSAGATRPLGQDKNGSGDKEKV